MSEAIRLVGGHSASFDDNAPSGAGLSPALWHQSPGPRSRDRRLGDSAHEAETMSGPEELHGDDWISFAIDMEGWVVHQPRLSAVDDRECGEHLEASGVDALDDLDASIMVSEVID